MYEGYATYGGVEIINNARARVLGEAYSANWYRGPHYPELAAVLGEYPNDSGAVDPSFSDPTNAPWYDADRADLSNRFFGVFGIAMPGSYSSTRSVPYEQNAGDGGVFGVPRKGMRSLKVRAFMTALGEDALEYGIAWLTASLEEQGCAQQTDSCHPGDVMFFTDVPTTSGEATELSRYLKMASVTSGPFEVAQYGNDGVVAREIEWTWLSERGFIYTAPRAVDLEIAPALSLIQDAPINWIKYPSAELEEDADGYTEPKIATNLASANPGLEVDATGWAASATTVTGSSAASYLTSGRVADAFALGAYSFRARILGNGSTSASGTNDLKITAPSISVTTVPAGSLVTCAIWAAAKALTGSTAAVTSITVTGQWLTAGDADVGAPFALTETTEGLGVYRSVATVVPATATKVKIVVTARVAWDSGNTDATNGDVRLYADAETISFYGGA